MLQGILVQMSLSGTFQVSFFLRLTRVLARLIATFEHKPKGILCVENNRFMGYAQYSDLYKADVMFSDQSNPLPVR